MVCDRLIRTVWECMWLHREVSIDFSLFAKGDSSVLSKTEVCRCCRPCSLGLRHAKILVHSRTEPVEWFAVVMIMFSSLLHFASAALEKISSKCLLYSTHTILHQIEKWYYRVSGRLLNRHDLFWELQNVHNATHDVTRTISNDVYNCYGDSVFLSF